MYLLRVQLPDAPGSLGAVASALGSIGVDIEGIEIVHKGEGAAINDFMITTPAEVQTDSVVSVCAEIKGVEVVWISHYPTAWGIHSDIEALDQMSATPERAVNVLVEYVPAVLHSAWAVAFDNDGVLISRTEIAPPFEPAHGRLLQVDKPSRAELDRDWVEGIGPMTIAAVPSANGSTIVVGRSGGPTFLDSELKRLRHLASLAS